MSPLPTAGDCVLSVQNSGTAGSVTDAGDYNWVLVSSERRPATKADPHGLKLENAGGGSVMEMAEWLKKDRVQCGLLRLCFGKGRYRRSKLVFIQWVGDEIGAVKRGRAMASEAAIKKALAPFAVALKFGDGGLGELTPETVVEEVKKTVVTDSGGANEDANLLTVADFLAALEEERQAHAAFFSAAEVAGNADEEKEELDLAESLQLVRDSGCPENWLLLKPRS
jgi:hypothetical protein